MKKDDELELIKAENLLLKEQIKQLRLLKEQLLIDDSFDLDDIIALELNKLSVPKSYKGYSLLITMIHEVVEDRKNVFSLVNLYNQLSEEFGVTPHAIENNVYRSICLSKKLCDKEVLEDYFGKNVTISVAEFIVTIADKVHRKYYKQKNKQKMFT